jgi:two-component system, NtrC family, response regulator HydG
MELANCENLPQSGTVQMPAGATMRFVPRVLIVEDDPSARDALARMMPRERYVCEMAESAAVAQKILGRSTFDTVVAEVRVDGFALLDQLRREKPTLPVVLVSASAEIREAVDAMKRGAFHYLTKPYQEAEFLAAVDGAVSARRRAPASASDGLGLVPTRRAKGVDPSPPPAIHTSLELVGTGQAMTRLRETIALVAASSAPVLVTGESGVGKELVARAIHAASARRGQAFVDVNTSAIPADLLEAEIFGHVRGGFTGAAQARKGLLTEASGGTLLLDEIGDMPLDLQAKILRVLQFGEVRPVGSDRAHHVDVRVIAATHRDLPTLVREGRFREDLYFRLDILPVAVPPLRERAEDIPPLVAHHLAKALLRSPDSPVRSIEPCALEILAAAPWRGNVRELVSVIERLVVFVREERIEARHLSFMSVAPPPLPAPSSMLPMAGPSAEAPWTMRRMMEAYAEQVLAQTGGNKQRAAEILDVDLSTLYRWERARKGSQKDGLDAIEDEGGRRPRARRSRSVGAKGASVPPDP